MSYYQPADPTGPSVEQLLGEIATETNAIGSAPNARAAAVIEETAESLFGGAPMHVDDGLVKESLPELMLLLVGLRTNQAHGKGIMEDLSQFFGTSLSPGTVYPALHALEEEGLLEMRELVQTKEYVIDDEDVVRDRLRQAMAQHLALGVIFQRALGAMDVAEES